MGEVHLHDSARVFRPYSAGNPAVIPRASTLTSAQIDGWRDRYGRNGSPVTGRPSITNCTSPLSRARAVRRLPPAANPVGRPPTSRTPHAQLAAGSAAPIGLRADRVNRAGARRIDYGFRFADLHLRLDRLPAEVIARCCGHRRTDLHQLSGGNKTRILTTYAHAIDTERCDPARRNGHHRQP